MEIIYVQGLKEGRLHGLPHLQYTNFLSLSDKESVIMSPVVFLYTFRKKLEIKTLSVLTKLPSSLVL